MGEVGVQGGESLLCSDSNDHSRYTNLQKIGSATLREQEEATRSRDSAGARVELAEAKLAKAISSRTQIVVARNAAEAARADVQRSTRGVDLSETANDQVRVVELLVGVKEAAVEEASRARAWNVPRMRVTTPVQVGGVNSGRKGSKTFRMRSVGGMIFGLAVEMDGQRGHHHYEPTG